MNIFFKDEEGWYIKIKLGPRLWIVLGRWN